MLLGRATTIPKCQNLSQALRCLWCSNAQPLHLSKETNVDLQFLSHKPIYEFINKKFCSKVKNKA